MSGHNFTAWRRREPKPPVIGPCASCGVGVTECLMLPDVAPGVGTCCDRCGHLPPDEDKP